MGNFGFVGPTGSGKDLDMVAWTVDELLQAQEAEIDYKVYANYAMFNGDNYPGQPGTPLEQLSPLETVENIPVLNNCTLNLTELPLSIGVDPRMTANRQSIFYTRAMANLRKQHVHFKFNAKDPESDVDKRIRFNVDQWTAPMYSEQADMLIECIFRRWKNFSQAFDDDRLIDDAEELRPIPQISRFFPYYDTDQLFDNFRAPFALDEKAKAFAKWLSRNSIAKGSPGSLSEWIVRENLEPPTSDQRKAILYFLERFPSGIATPKSIGVLSAPNSLS